MCHQITTSFQLVPALFLAVFLHQAAAHGQDDRSGSVDSLRNLVNASVEELESPLRTERLRAERKLIEAGPKILPYLPPPDLIDSVSAREAVRRIRIQLERKSATQSVQATTVTLTGTKPLESILAEITKQTENRIDISGIPSALRTRSIDVAFEDEPFWRAIDALSQQAGFEIGDSAEGRLKLSPVDLSDRPNPQVSYSGSTRIELRSITFKELRGDENRRLLRISLGLRSEPRLRPLFLDSADRDFSVKDVDDEPLELYTPRAKHEFPLGQRGNGVQRDLLVTVAADALPESISLKARMSMTVAAGTEQIAFAGPLKSGVARRRGGVTVRLLDVRRTDHRGLRLRIGVSYDTGGRAFESHRNWIYHNEVMLLAGEEKIIEPEGPIRTALEADGAIAVEYEFTDVESPQDARFVYAAPTLIIRTPIEFEFRDLPVGAQ